MPLGPQLVTFGNVQSTWLLTVTITPAATNSATTLEQTFTVPGLAVGDQVTMTANFAYSSLVDWVNVRASAANTLAVAFSNNTAGSLTAPAGAYTLEINRPLAGMSMTAIQ